LIQQNPPIITPRKFQNVRIIANYYTRINLTRMAELLDLDGTKTEEFLARLVNNGGLKVKIDRPSGVVYFTHKKSQAEVLNDWAGGLNELMASVNKICHLINKEQNLNQAQVNLKKVFN
jgi:26S proteasome regulatory subunit N5